MSYQPPGPYPVFPQQGGFGAAPKPPIPPTVRRAFVLMLVGAGLEVVNVVLSFLFSNEVDSKIQQAINAGTVTTSTNVNIASTAAGGIIGIGLWVWMAYTCRAGKNWARITGTVFFGISCLGILGDLVIVAAMNKWIGGIAYLLVLENAVGWLVGLLTVILLWKRESAAYFKPLEYVQYPMPPYPYPAMPGQPMQPGAAPQQQPTDPWGTPPNG